MPSTLFEIEEQTFMGCTNLRQVVLNEGLQKIGRGAFNGTRLRSITFPSSLINVCDDAFRDCKSLRTLVLNKGLQKIEKSAFDGCSNLRPMALNGVPLDVVLHIVLMSLG